MLLTPDSEGDPSFFRELDRITEQVDQHLAQFALVRAHILGHMRGVLNEEGKFLVSGP